MALKADEQYVYDSIVKAGGMPEVEEAVMLILKYRGTDFYESKNTIINNWQIDYQGIYDLIISIFTITLTNEETSYQAMVGRLNHKIKIDDEIGRIKITADLIGLVVTTGLIDMHSPKGEYHILSTEYVIDGLIPIEDRHTILTAKPEPTASNWDGKQSVILGHSMNHHNDYVRLSHLRRMEQIAFRVNKEFIDEYEEAPKNDPVTTKQIIQWVAFKEESLRQYEELTASDNEFFIKHKYDCRGRSYASSYYLNIQGSSFKKAIIELTDKEVVEGF